MHVVSTALIALYFTSILVSALPFPFFSISIPQISLPPITVPSIPAPTVPNLSNLKLPSIDVDRYAHPNLTADCKDALKTQLISVGLACADVTALSTAISSPDFDYYSVLENEKFLNSFCSTNCTNATRVFESNVQTVCGNQTLLSSNIGNVYYDEVNKFFWTPKNETSTPSSTPTPTAFPTPVLTATPTPIPSSPANNTLGLAPLYVSTIASYLRAIQALACLKNSKTNGYCLVEEYKGLAATNSTHDLYNATSALQANKTLLCTDCVKLQLDTAANQTTLVDYASLKPALNNAYATFNKTCLA